MRNGFKSSRGAIRGIIGGTVGLATVAIGFRSFPLHIVTRIRSSACGSLYRLGPTTKLVEATSFRHLRAATRVLPCASPSELAPSAESTPGATRLPIRGHLL